MNAPPPRFHPATTFEQGFRSSAPQTACSIALLDIHADPHRAHSVCISAQPLQRPVEPTKKPGRLRLGQRGEIRTLR